MFLRELFLHEYKIRWMIALYCLETSRGNLCLQAKYVFLVIGTIKYGCCAHVVAIIQKIYL